MAFDKPTRNRLASFVSEARNLITDEFRQQFQSIYGIAEKGAMTPLDQLRDLDDAGLSTATLLRERIEYLVNTHPDDKGGAQAAVDRLAREQAFTVLNRLSAIRLAEKRDLIVESVGKGYQSRGFKVFEQVAGSGLGDTYQRYRRYLFCLFDELAVDLGVLFDRRSPQGLLFPREPALLELLQLLNAPNLERLWIEDETIGWIYQYYNDPAERKKMRDESAAPRNSRELAVRNQFFTPRYVVEFLTDNTLGRIWYEMTQGQTRLKEQCRYLVRRPTEIFLNPGDIVPDTPLQDGLSQEELLKQPVYIAHRPLKDPRAIRMLDPACGSMHFGLYAYDLYEVIYEEAWDLEETLGADALNRSLGMKSLHDTYANKDAFLTDVPRLIIEHNIHGIDIDPRAVQIAGLSLWLRAQRAWQQQRLQPQERPDIRRSNIICAEPMPGDEALLDEFISAQLSATPEHKLLGQLVRRVFDAMKLAGEAGSLLKIEEEIAGAVNEAKQKWLTRPKMEQGRLFADDAAQAAQMELSLDVTGITDETFWEKAEERIYAALQSYAEQAENGRGFQHRLFAEDAVRGFAFIDLCRQRYDVVLMNPPFGASSNHSIPYLRKRYPIGYIDLYTSFLDCGTSLNTQLGKTGAITSRTAFTLATFEEWRRVRLLGDTAINVCCDLGHGVLDNAMVETAAFTLGNPPPGRQMMFFRLDDVKAKEKSLLEEVMSPGLLSHLTSAEQLLAFPKASIAYSLDPRFYDDFRYLPRIEEIGSVVGGNKTGDDFRFIRLAWEVPLDGLSAGPKTRWKWISKGGEYSLYYDSIHLVVDWRDDGGLLGEYLYLERPRNGYLWGPKSWSHRFMGDPGIVWSMRSQKGLSFRALPRGCAMSGKSSIVKTDSRQTDLALLAILNTEGIAKLVDCFATFGSYERGAIASIPVDLTQVSKFARFAEDAFAAVQSISSLSEVDWCFSPLCCKGHLSIAALRKEQQAACDQARSQLVNTCKAIEVSYRHPEMPEGRTRNEFFLSDLGNVGCESVVSEALGFGYGRWDIRYATGERQRAELPEPFDPLPICPPGQLQNEQGLPITKEDVEKLKAEGQWDYPIDIPWDGILVDDSGHPLDIETRVHQVLQVIWKDRWEAIEHEACEILSVKSLRDYFRKPSGFFADHLKRYSKSRRQAPIYWPLSTVSGSYTLWIYYHRLTENTLHTTLADFIDPKLRSVRAEISSLRESKVHRDRLEELLDLEQELEDFRAEIERIIKLPWKPPNLNDGVLITASPLWKLFRLPKWQKDLKACWEKLANGDYDWAHLAYTIWPKRVEEVCKTDRSIAIAHDLEHLCTVAAPKPKTKRGKKASTPAFEGMES